MKSPLILLIAFTIFSAPLGAQLSPTDSLRKIHVTPGYRVELAAAEPLTLDPVAIDWDTSGRLWVVEMADYPLGLDSKGKPGGRVRILEDTNNDGVYDKSTLFADALNFPTGLITWRDGVIITAAPEIIFLRDTDRDGHADKREALFSGFLEGNQQLRINGLRWGLDNWIYCAVGGHYRGYGASTKIKSHRTGEEIALGSRDFRFRPDTGEFDPQSGPAQFGRDRDDWGHWFGTQNSNPLWHYVLADQYVRRNPHVAAPNLIQQVMRPVNPPIFPISEAEKRFHSFEHKGHFTSGCSGMIYRDNWLFPAGVTHAFACEPFHNLVHHEILTDDGVSYAAGRTPAEQASEFFASEDSWTRPVMTRTGPDGALWVVDMYRKIIEHPDWLPPEGRDELLPEYRKGDDKGRIYRVVLEKEARRKILNLDELSTAKLIAALDTSNGWQRDKAQQLLLWRKDATAVPLLKHLARTSTNALARLHALCTLDGFDALTPDLLEPELKDPNPGLRENALRLAERNFTPGALGLTNDPDAKVRLQLACSLGAWPGPAAGEALVKIAANEQASPFFAAAILSSALPHLDTLVSHLSDNDIYSESLLQIALEINRRDLLQRLLEPAIKRFRPERSLAFVRALQRRKTSIEELIKAVPEDALSAQLRGFGLTFDLAKGNAKSPRPKLASLILLTFDPTNRNEALHLLGRTLKPATPIEDQRAAITAMADTADESVPRLLLLNWNSKGPEARAAILEALLRRENWAFALLEEIETGAVATSDLDAARRNRLVKHDSPRVRSLASKLFSKSVNANRAKVIEDFRPALQLAGNPARGQQTFAKICAACHQRDALGHDVGPNLRSVIAHPPEKLLASILDPNADIQPGYNAYTCALSNGEELNGLISSETAASVIFKFADGTSRSINRSEIQSLHSSNLSLMPEGLEAGLTSQDMADLISFLKTP